MDRGVAKRREAFLVCSALALCLCACLGGQRVPENPENICDIFRQNKKWYEHAYASSRRWGVPIPVMMAILYQESKFKADAKPPRTTCLWIFPGPRPSSAYGYAQALNSTWEHYKRYTGKRRAQRHDFADAVDFVGWYCYISYTKCGISRVDAYNLYLAYHEGQGGFNRRTYAKKPWLRRVASGVAQRAKVYERQLASCEGEFLKKRPCLWFF